MTANYDLESIKENVESLRVENKLLFKVANNYKFISLVSKEKLFSSL